MDGRRREGKTKSVEAKLTDAVGWLVGGEEALRGLSPRAAYVDEC